MLCKVEFALQVTCLSILLENRTAQFLNLLHVLKLRGAELLAASLLSGPQLSEFLLKKSDTSVRQGDFVSESNHLLLRQLQLVLQSGISVGLLLVLTVFLEALRLNLHHLGLQIEDFGLSRKFLLLGFLKQAGEVLHVFL